MSILKSCAVSSKNFCPLFIFLIKSAAITEEEMYLKRSRWVTGFLGCETDKMWVMQKWLQHNIKKIFLVLCILSVYLNFRYLACIAMSSTCSPPPLCYGLNIYFYLRLGWCWKGARVIKVVLAAVTYEGCQTAAINDSYVNS